MTYSSSERFEFKLLNDNSGSSVSFTDILLTEGQEYGSGVEPSNKCTCSLLMSQTEATILFTGRLCFDHLDLPPGILLCHC